MHEQRYIAVLTRHFLFWLRLGGHENCRFFGDLGPKLKNIGSLFIYELGKTHSMPFTPMSLGFQHHHPHHFRRLVELSLFPPKEGSEMII